MLEQLLSVGRLAALVMLNVVHRVPAAELNVLLGQKHYAALDLALPSEVWTQGRYDIGVSFI